MAIGYLRRLAATGPVPVFAVLGAGAANRVNDLGLEPGLILHDSPRHASVLLIAGAVRPADRDDVRRVHDQLPHPRATLCWDAPVPDGLQQPVMIAAREDPAAALRTLYRDLMTGARPSEPDLVTAPTRAPWRGVGPHGQGGKGMMGGNPYGRSMAMTDDDLRDGLALDAYTLRLGPFLPALPPGMVMDCTLQGDVMQKASFIRPPLPTGAPATAGSPADAGLAVAAERLRRVARMVRLLELDALAERILRMARDAAAASPDDIDRLTAALRRAGVFAAIPEGLGTISARAAAALGHAAQTPRGLPARNAGSTRPAAGDALATDARGRLHHWLEEARAALATAPLRADGRTTRRAGAGAASSRQAKRAGHPASSGLVLDDLLRGLEWHEAVLVIASFDTAALGALHAAEETQAAHADGEGKHE